MTWRRLGCGQPPRTARQSVERLQHRHGGRTGGQQPHQGLARRVRPRLGRPRQRDVTVTKNLVGDLHAGWHQAGDLPCHARTSLEDTPRVDAASRARVGRRARGQRPRWQAVTRIGILAQRSLHQSQRRNAVDHGVVDFAVDRDAPVGESLHDVRLPQRTVPVEKRPVPP